MWIGLVPGDVRATDHDAVHTVRVWRPEGRPANVSQLSWAADPTRRLLYGVDNNGAWLGLYDLDTLELRSSLVVAGGTPPSLVRVDTTNGELLVAVSAGALGGATLVRFGMVNGALARRGAIDLRSQLGADHRVIGLYQYPASARVWVLATSALTSGVKMAELDMAGMAEGAGRVTWVRDMAADCPAPMKAGKVDAGLGYIPSSGALYFGCGALGNASRQVPQDPGVARLFLRGDPRNGPTQPEGIEKFPRPGQFTDADSVVDVVGQRVIISARSAAAGGVTLYGFDVRTGTWVGGTSAGTNQFSAVGLDEVNGRVYGVSQDSKFGLVAMDIRPTPLPQARRYPSYHKNDGHLPVAMNMPVDWVAGRIFFSYGGGEAVWVVHDGAEPIPDPSLEDPDKNTVDMPEAPGRTRSAYSGLAQAFGSRYRWVGGPQNLWYNLTGDNELGPEESRELRGAFLNSLTVANGEASAAAIAADRDGHTAAQQVLHPHEEAPAVEVHWPYREARCVDFGGRPSQSREDGAVVTCDADKQKASADAVFDATSSEAGVKVGRSEYSAQARLDHIRGIVVTVEAIAKNVLLTDGPAEVLRIGEVRVKAEAWAHGRPGTAGSAYERVVKDVYVHGSQQCATTCTMAQLAATTRMLAGTKFKVTFPVPDKKLAAGSPKGYQALVRRSLPEQLEEIVINGQPPDRVEVPGLVIVASFDNYFRDRMIVELAATAAEARYGISLLGADVVDPDAGGGALVPLVALGNEGTGMQSGEGSFPSMVAPMAATPSLETPTTTAGPFEALPISIGRTAGLIWQGLSRGLRLFPIWAVLLAPVYLTARRWLLLQRGSLFSGGRS